MGATKEVVEKAADRADAKQLKAEAYDILVQIERLQQGIQHLQQQLTAKNQEIQAAIAPQ